MIAVEGIVAVLLCAGRSVRFGPRNKLFEPLKGAALVEHAARALASLPFLERVAVVPAGEQDEFLPRLPGFTLVANERQEAGQDHSVRLGIAAARTAGGEAALICLGDMPNINSLHLLRLAQASDAAHPAASASADWISPPCLIPKRFFGAALEEERTVRDLLRSSETRRVEPADARLLADFDTQEDFAPEALAETGFSR